MNSDTLLSHWWRTESCRQAFERAKEKRQERIAKFTREVAERKAEQTKQIWGTDRELEQAEISYR